MDREWLVVIGLSCDIVGALVLAWALLLSPKEAIERGVGEMPWVSDEDNLRLPAVQHLLRQARNTRIGLVLLALGFALQVAGQWPS